MGGTSQGILSLPLFIAINATSSFTMAFITSPSRRVIAALLCATALVFAPHALLAQEQIGAKITPPLIEERTDPGAMFAHTLDIVNVSDTAEIFYPRVRDIVGIAESGQPIFAKPGDPNDYELSSWVTFDVSELRVPARSAAKLRFTVKVPSTAGPGAHIGLVAISTAAPANLVGSAVGYEVGSILAIRISGDIVEDTRLGEFFADKVIYDQPNVTFSARIDNMGNVFARPKGFVDIINMFGTKVETLTFNNGGASVFPKSKRTYTVDWTSDKLQIGKYRADLTLVIEGSQGMQNLNSTLSFWIIPLNIILPILGGLLVFLLVFYVLLRMYVNRQISRATGGKRVASSKDTSALSKLSIVVIAVLLSVILGFVVLLFLVG